MNERITENLFRRYIENDECYLGGIINVEEPKSKNIKINKLLSNASKSGNGKGYPEFIVTFDYYPIFTISNYGQTIGDTTDTILLKLKYKVTCDYKSATTVNVNNTSITPQKGTFEFEFYTVFKLNTPTSFSINKDFPSDGAFSFISNHLKDIDCNALGFGDFIFKGTVTTNDPTYSTLTIK